MRTTFAEAGFTAGSTHEGDLYAGMTVGGGYRLTDLVWLHAVGAAGTAPVIHAPGVDQYENTHDSFAELRGGLELHLCSGNRVVCALAGVDLGYRHETFMDTMTQNQSSAEAVARFGLDLGNRVLRVRPVLEGTSTRPGDTSALVVGVAYLW